MKPLKFSKAVKRRTVLRSTHHNSGYIWLIIDLLVLIVGTIIVIVLARIMHQLLPPPASTNGVSFYYATQNENQVQTPINGVSGVDVLPQNAVGTSANFTFSYGITGTNCWATKTNPPPTQAGQYTTLVNNSNEYCISVNMGTYEQVLDYDAQNNTQLSSVSNPPINLLISKSTNLVDWTILVTNLVVPDSIQTWTDTNAIQSQAYYRVSIP